MQLHKWFTTGDYEDSCILQCWVSDALLFQVWKTGKTVRLDALVEVPDEVYGTVQERRLVGNFRNAAAARIAASRYKS